jgi:hypothetical protein
VVLVFGLTVAPVAAQQAPVFLEPGHWTYEAIRRLGVAGVAPLASDPALAPVTLQHARAAFEYAAAEAERRGRSDLARLASGYLDVLEPGDTAGVLASAALRGGWLSTSGEALGGDGYIAGFDWQGAQPLGGASGPAVAVRAHGWLRARLAWSFDGGYLGDEWRIPAAAVTGALGPIDVWAGRRRLHYGAGGGGAVVLGSGTGIEPDLADRMFATVDGLGVHVRRPFHFPSFLRFLGPTRIEVVAGRLPRNGNVERPYVVFGRLIGSPFTRRLTLGLNRGAIFGGTNNPVTPRRLAGLLLGLHQAGFENQVVSAVLRFRPPAGALPLEFYYEGGMDDTAGSFWDVPATVVGVDVGALPGLSAVAAGFEHTRYARLCCGNTIWYRSVFFRGSWADEGRLFAHPLGGHGREWLAHLRVDLPQRGLLLRAEVMARRRGAENLYAPEREGRSYGGSVSVWYAPRPATVLRFDAGFEDAQRWTLHRLGATVSHTIGRAAR